MPRLRVNTTYRIHWILHTPSTACTEYCILCVLHQPIMDCLPLPASLSSLGRPCCTQYPTFPQLGINQYIDSQLPLRLPPELLPSSTPPISLDHALQVYFQTRLITVSKCISKLAWLQPRRLQNHGLWVPLQTCTIMASKFISELARSQLPSVSLYSLDCSLQV